MSREKFNEKSTLMGRMGFQDPELKENVHDRIIAELYNDGTLQYICQKYVYPYIINEKFKDVNMNSQIFKKITNFEIKLTHQLKCVEFPIYNKSYAIGFIDLYVFTTISHPLPKYSSLRQDYNVMEGKTDIHLIFEAKSTNLTLGELMRQLNMYQKHIKECTPTTNNSLYFYFIVVPQNIELRKYKSIIENHSWTYVQYPFNSE